MSDIGVTTVVVIVVLVFSGLICYNTGVLISDLTKEYRLRHAGNQSECNQLGGAWLETIEKCVNSDVNRALYIEQTTMLRVGSCFDCGVNCPAPCNPVEPILPGPGEKIRVD